MDWSGEKIGSVSMGGSCLMLSEIIRDGRPTLTWVGLSNDSLFQSYTDCGVTIEQEPQNWNWGYEK